MRHEYEIVEHPHLEYLNLFLVKMAHRRLHLHREFEICMVLDGEITVYTTGKTTVLKKEDVILLNPRQVHAFHSMTENALILSIQVMPGAFEKIWPGIRYAELETLCLSEPRYQGETLEHLRELFYRLGIAYSWPTITFFPDFFSASRSIRQSSSVRHTGFSTSTFIPFFSAFTVCSACI